MGEVTEITNTLSSLANNPNVRDNDVLQTLVQTMSKVSFWLLWLECLRVCNHTFILRPWCIIISVRHARVVLSKA